MIESPRSLLTIWSRLVASSLVSAGVREVVVSPGSRSTPFVLALRARPELELVSVIDERSAAFVALGMARASRRPTAVLATSGTAPAHWLPAVIEASLAQVPLLLLSADRPLALTHAGAAQTIDQTKLFGSWVRHFEDLGDPRADQGALVGVSRSIAQAVAATGGSAPGPVHVNLRADKPLEPVEPSADERALADAAETLVARGTTRIGHATVGADVETARALAAALAEAKRPLVIAGPRREESDRFVLLEACARARAPVAAEATSQLRFWTADGRIPRRVRDDPRERALPARSDAGSDRADRRPADRTHARARAHGRAALRARCRRRLRSDRERGGDLVRAGGPDDGARGLAPRVVRARRGLAREARARRGAGVARGGAHRRPRRGRGRVRPRGARGLGRSAPRRRQQPADPHDRSVRARRRRGANRALATRRERHRRPGLGRARSRHHLRAAGGRDRRRRLVRPRPECARQCARRAPTARRRRDRQRRRSDLRDASDRRHAERARGDALFTTPHEIDLASIVRAMGVACTETRRASETRAAVAGAIAGRGVHVVRAIVDPDDATRSFRALSSAIADSLAEIGA